MNDTPDSTLDPGEEPRQDLDQAEAVPAPRAPAQPPGEYRAAPVPSYPEDLGRIPPPRNLAALHSMDETQPPRRRSSPMLGCLTGLALLVALLSLALNVYFLYVLSTAQHAAVENIDAAILTLEDWRSAGFHYEYRFQQDVPVVADIPVEQEMIIPVEGNVPINTTIEIPIDAGVLGTFAVDVPIDTNVYVDTEVPINIDQTVTVNTSIPISMTMPIDIAADDPEIEGILGGMQAWLIDLRDSLSRRLIPAWLPIEN